MKTRSFRDKFRETGSDDEAGFRRRVVAELSSAALRANFLAISKQVPAHAMIPMVKADGYGHGIAWAARELLDMKALYGFGVATLEEGRLLRSELGMRARKTRIIVFSGAADWSDGKGAFCEAHGLTPVIASEDDWSRFYRGGWCERLDYDLKFNTGMNRLGLNPASASRIARELRLKPGEEHPSCVHSHLAIAEKPTAPLSLKQRERFSAIRAELSGALPSTQFALANSAAIWNSKHWRLDDTDIVRPGLSLYGVPPWAEAPERGITPVLTLKARVIARHLLKPGESIGYGATYTVPSTSKESVHAAVLGAGYGDGVHRRLSNGGHAWVSGRASHFIGIVSMDLSAVRSSPETKVGDDVEILGPHVDIWGQAKQAQTIPYELLTSLTARVQREYV